MASRFVSSNQQEIEKLLEDKVYKTIIGFGFCDIRNNQGRGKCYQPKPKAEADNTDRLFYYTLSSSNFSFLAGSMKRIEKPFLLRCPRT